MVQSGGPTAEADVLLGVVRARVEDQEQSGVSEELRV